MRLLPKLLLLTLGPWVVASAVWAIAVMPLNDRALTELHQQLARTQLHNEALRFSTQLAVIRGELKVMAVSTVVQSGDIERSVERLRTYLGSLKSGLVAIALHAPDGRAFPAAGKPFMTTDREYFDEFLAHKPFVSNAVRSRAQGGQPVIVIGEPVFSPDGQWLGALGGAVPIGDLLANIRALPVGDAGFSMLVDDRGRVLSSRDGPDAIDAFVDQPQSPLKDKLADDAKESLHHPVVLSWQGETYVAFAEKIEGTRYSLALCYSLNEWRAVHYRFVRYGLAMLAGLALLGALATLFLRRLLLLPIREVRDAQMALGKGDMERRARVLGGDELGDLAESWNLTADRLARTILGLEHAQSELRNESDKFRGMFNGALSHMGLLDVDGNLIEVNEAALAFSGTSRAELLGKNLIELPWVSELDADEAFLKALEDARRGTIQRRRPANVLGHSFDLSITPIKDDHGVVKFLLAEARDITDITEAQENMQRLEAQLRQAQKMEAIGTLAGGIAHDFNNILAIIMGNLELLEPNLRSDDGKIKLAQIENAAIRARDLVRQILTFSRRNESAKKRISIAGIIQETVNLLRSATPAMIKIEADIEPHLPEPLADPVQIHQVLMNLSTNAVAAMEGFSDGALTFKARSETRDNHPGVAIVLRDTGTGIAPGIIDRIFDPFFTTKGPHKGTGLGLAVVDGIIREHGGSVNVENCEPHGAQFTVWLPLNPDDAEPTASPPPSPTRLAPPASIARNKSGPYVIAVVDDEKAVGGAIGLMLDDLGHTARVYDRPVKFLEDLAAGLVPDALITDLNMPTTSGLELSRLVRAQFKDLPIALMSGLEVTNLRQLEELAIHCVIDKPFSRASIAESIAKLFATLIPDPSPIGEKGDLASFHLPSPARGRGAGG